MLWRSINYSKASGQSYYARATAPMWSGPYAWHTENLFPAFSYCHIEDVRRFHHALCCIFTAGGRLNTLCSSPVFRRE
jgi:hypothetical protein